MDNVISLRAGPAVLGADPPALLLLEDHPVLRARIAELLREHCAAVELHMARTHVEALRMAAAKRIDVAIVDAGLGGGDGFRLARELQAVRRDLAVVALVCGADLPPYCRVPPLPNAVIVAMHELAARLPAVVNRVVARRRAGAVVDACDICPLGTVCTAPRRAGGPLSARAHAA